mmetsp:Transcript_30694/g.89299  ORF Transcript_30694/g.89299 Transcript_30694/m.89299 type:complete len:232 (-) Transcript_30694:2205-2900(-)
MRPLPAPPLRSSPALHCHRPGPLPPPNHPPEQPPQGLCLSVRPRLPRRVLPEPRVPHSVHRGPPPHGLPRQPNAGASVQGVPQRRAAGAAGEDGDRCRRRPRRGVSHLRQPDGQVGPAATGAAGGEPRGPLMAHHVATHPLERLGFWRRWARDALGLRCCGRSDGGVIEGRSLWCGPDDGHSDVAQWADVREREAGRQPGQGGRRARMDGCGDGVYVSSTTRLTVGWVDAT